MKYMYKVYLAFLDKCVRKHFSDNYLAMIQPTSDKPLPEPMMTDFNEVA